MKGLGLEWSDANTVVKKHPFADVRTYDDRGGALASILQAEAMTLQTRIARTSGASSSNEVYRLNSQPHRNN